MTKEEIINKIVALTGSKKQEPPLVPYSGQESRKTVFCINPKTGETVFLPDVDLDSGNCDSVKDTRQEKDTYQETNEANKLIQQEIDALILELWNKIEQEMNNLITPSDKIFYLENLMLDLECDGCYHRGVETLLHDELKLWKRKREIWEKKQALNQQQLQQENPIPEHEPITNRIPDIPSYQIPEDKWENLTIEVIDSEGKIGLKFSYPDTGTKYFKYEELEKCGLTKAIWCQFIVIAEEEKVRKSRDYHSRESLKEHNERKNVVSGLRKFLRKLTKNSEKSDPFIKAIGIKQEFIPRFKIIGDLPEDE